MASYLPTLQSYFQASSMPKRLLQYALSRLEILDTDALDLENLDIAWGKNSVFEFRDVGLRLRKLEAILQLPPSFEINKARVLLLRLTIPVDIYSSPIIVEVDGVEGQFRVKTNPEKGTTRTNHDRKRKQPRSRSFGTGQGSSRTYTGRRGSDYADEDDYEPAMPTAADLAASFLQAEPEEERAELEAAILSQTQEIGIESVLSEDEEFPVGTGAPLSLPGFMTRFLQGIVDRLQVRIRGITVNLDLDIPSEASKSPLSNSTDPVTIQLRIEDIDIEGVTDLEHAAGEDDNKTRYKDGKRLVSLSKIRASLISEANLFSTLSRSSALSSPSVAHSDILERNPLAKELSTTTSAIHPFNEPSEEPGSIASSRHLSISSLPRVTSDPRLLSHSVIASDSGRFDDASEEGSNMSESLRDSLSESEFQKSAYLDQLTESQYLDDEENYGRGSVTIPVSRDIRALQTQDSPLSTPRASMHIQPPMEAEAEYFDSHTSSGSKSQLKLYSSILSDRPHSRFSEGRVSQSQPLIPAELTEELSSVQPLMQSGLETSDDGSVSDRGGNSSTPVGEEDLTRSQLFSHEEAESMYLSAISHASSGRKVPGAWDDYSAGSDGTSSGPGSPIIPYREEIRDNLEHARQHSPEKSSFELENMQRSSISVAESTRTSKTSSSQNLPYRPVKPSTPQPSSGASEHSATSSNEYTRLTKQVLALERIDVYLPALNQEPSAPPTDNNNGFVSNTFDSQRDLSQSTAVNLPGAFSTHLPRQRSPAHPAIDKPSLDPVVETQAKDASIEVVLGQIYTQFDISIGRLVFMIVRRLQEALDQEPPISSKAKPESSNTEPTLDTFDFKLFAEKISIVFVERLEGMLGSHRTAAETSPWNKASDSEVLLRTSFSGLSINSQLSQSTSSTEITVQKYIFGYARENILSFDAGLQMRSSVRDLSAADGIDVRLKITKTKDVTRCEVVTLPMHISIDLQRLDETFSWFGGLSGVLNLGSSMASNATVTAVSPKAKHRGVHFDAPIRPDDKSQVTQNKADVRIGGFVLDLVGAECNIGVESSAVKIVNRDEGIGVFVSAIRLSGPHLKHSNEDPAIIADISSTRLEFLPLPREDDLVRLLGLITPSKSQYDQDDDILTGTLLKQRRQGSVLKLTVDDVQLRVSKLEELSYLPELGEEVARLATVAKYLPDDDRPGLLSFVLVRKLDAHVDVDNNLGSIQFLATDIDIAHISLPSLIALNVNTVSAHRNSSEELLGLATDPELREPKNRAPAIMARMIGDEMEPVVKIKLWNIKVEYRVPTLMTLLGLAEGATQQDISTSLAGSVATLTDFIGSKASKGNKKPTSSSSPASKPLAVDVVMKDCIFGLNPLGLPSKLLVVLTEAHLNAVLPKDGKTSATVDLNKASLLIVDNVAHVITGDLRVRPRRQSFDGGSSQVADLCAMGFVSVSYISSAKAVVVVSADNNGEQCVDVELRDDLFVLESCADSTQTLVSILSALAPPSIPSKEIKYRTKVIPVQDLLASLSGDAFGTAEGDYNFDDDFGIGALESELGEGSDELDFDSHFFQRESNDPYDESIMEEAQLSSRDTNDGVLLASFAEPEQPQVTGELEFHEDYFGTGSVLEGTAHRWNSTKNTYDKLNLAKIRKSPLKICVRDVHFIWNLFDGYDWQNTRDAITKAVQDVESKAIEKRARNERRSTFDLDIDDEEDTVIGDFLFNSIYIGIPANRDPRELATVINQDLNDNITETESIATTQVSSSPSRQGSSRRPKTKRLRLNRSKNHKITFELKGVNADIVTFPSGSGETQSSVDVRVHDLEVFDHVPTSTWRKFATYMQDAGERETGSNMIHIEILNVKPIPDLAAAEIVLKATLLPLRLHVDQDALDFITRFFEFKDDSKPVNGSPGDVPFIQRAEVNSVIVKLDFKPKRVDYAGLRSGHTTEFMNFLILDEADMVLRHTIIYGVSGFDKLGKCLNDIWMPDIKRNQLPGILAGLAPVRSLVNVGGGFKHLVTVPIREYKKDGRVVRGISKGAAAFAKTTGTELVKLGAKVAIGVQTALQGAEGFLGPTMDTGDDGEDDEDTKQISLYANQPVGVLQGLRGGYTGLQRDLVMARDAIIAVPGEVMESGNAAGVLRAVRKHAPTVILRPAIGVAKAGGQILMGATNSLDPVNLQRADAKYKKH